jgi:hypothetical protein
MSHLWLAHHQKLILKTPKYKLHMSTIFYIVYYRPTWFYTYTKCKFLTTHTHNIDEYNLYFKKIS